MGSTLMRPVFFWACAAIRPVLAKPRVSVSLAITKTPLWWPVSVLRCASGGGKSSLLNRLRPELRLRTGEVLDKTGLGRHTTTRTELFLLPEGGGLLADSPGLRGFDPWDLAPLELRDHFPDWREPQARCRFRTCLHRDEPECGVKAAVARGEIPAWRHEAYLALLADIESRRERHAP